MHIRASALCLILMLGGAAHAEWIKGDATAEDRQRDQSECERKARADVAFRRPQVARPGAMSGMSSANTMAAESQAFNLCMKDKGYVDTPSK